MMTIEPTGNAWRWDGDYELWVYYRCCMEQTEHGTVGRASGGMWVARIRGLEWRTLCCGSLDTCARAVVKWATEEYYHCA